MNFLNTWLQGIIVSVVIATIIEMILPSGNTKKYIKVVLGVYVVFNIITPIVNQFSNNNFEISSIIHMEEYNKKMESNTDITKANEENIKDIYISKIEKDIKAKLEEKDYIVEKVNVQIEDDETYKLKNISLCLEKKEKIEEENSETNMVEINEIETVTIQIGEQNEIVETKEKSNITKQEEKEVKKYLASVYEIKEKQIVIE